MATWEDLTREIIRFHEKLNYDENPQIRETVVDSINRAVVSLFSKADWTFKVQKTTMEFDPAEQDNQLPDNFLSFQHTGQVVLLLGDETTQSKRILEYKPFNQVMEWLNTPNIGTGEPEFYSLGGPLDGASSQRSIFLFPIPAQAVTLRLIYQATPPRCDFEDGYDEDIPIIPVTYHLSTLKEMAILNRLIDKGADVSVQAAIVQSVLESMMRNEPHGREDAIRMTPAYGWRMNIRHT